MSTFASLLGSCLYGVVVYTLFYLIFCPCLTWNKSFATHCYPLLLLTAGYCLLESWSVSIEVQSTWCCVSLGLLIGILCSCSSNKLLLACHIKPRQTFWWKEHSDCQNPPMASWNVEFICKLDWECSYAFKPATPVQVSIPDPRNRWYSHLDLFRLNFWLLINCSFKIQSPESIYIWNYSS